MSELIQGQLGGGIDERLYRINQGGQPEQIFEDFARATSPSWSADGHGIAFFGTETLPEAGFNPFSSLPGIMGQVLYPWDLYLMDADGANVRVILSGVVAGSATQWLSQGDRLSFSGAYKKTDGVWVLDTRTLALTRVWPYGTPYDWSPDGQQMVVIQQEAQDGEQHTHPMIVDVPSLDSD